MLTTLLGYPHMGVGATLVLFCCESVDAIHGDLFNRTRREAQYTRTTTTQTATAMRMLPDAEESVNAKALFLRDVPPNEQWHVMTDQSNNDKLIPSIHSAPTCGYASVAAGFSGRGRIVYISDLNAEPETCSILVSLAQSIFPDSHISGSDSDNSGVPYRDKARAEQHKTKGNAAYEAGSMQDAIASYTSAIAADHTNHVYFSNRALAYLKASHRLLCTLVELLTILQNSGNNRNANPSHWGLDLHKLLI